jgi:hypothetical protein
MASPELPKWSRDSETRCKTVFVGTTPTLLLGNNANRIAVSFSKRFDEFITIVGRNVGGSVVGWAILQQQMSVDIDWRTHADMVRGEWWGINDGESQTISVVETEAKH